MQNYFPGTCLRFLKKLSDKAQKTEKTECRYKSTSSFQLFSTWHHGFLRNPERILKKQAGNTALGLIIGLIIGLSIAVVVAITITKTTPFTNNGIKPERLPVPKTAASVSDPNKPLYNKETQKRAFKGVTGLANETSSPETDMPPAETEPESEPVPAAKTPKSSKSTSVHSSKSAAIATETAPLPITEISKQIETGKSINEKPIQDLSSKSRDKWDYYLQAGAFRSETDAENTRARLALQGVEAHIMQHPSDSGTLYRVRVGPFSQLEEMNQVRSKLSNNGVDVAVIHVVK